MGWGCSSAVEYLPSMSEVLDSVPSTTQKQGLKHTAHCELKQLLFAPCIQQWQVGVVEVWYWLSSLPRPLQLSQPDPWETEL